MENNPNQQPVENGPQAPASFLPPKKSIKIPVIITAVILLVAAGGAFGYFEYNKNGKKPEKTVENKINPHEVAQPTPGVPTATSTDTISLSTPNCDDPGAFRSRSGLVNWQHGSGELSDLALFPIITENVNNNAYFTQVLYYKVGTIISGKYKDGDIILADATTDGPSFQDSYFRFVHLNGRYTALEKYSDSMADLQTPKFTIDKNYTLPDLDFPSSIHSATPNASYTLDSRVHDYFCRQGMDVMFTDLNAGNIFTPTTSIPGKLNVANSQTKVFEKNAFFAEAPDGTVRVYALNNPITDSSNVPLITWSDGKQNKREYSFQAKTGCGSVNYRDVVAFNSFDLQQTGTAINNYPVYEFKDPHADELQKMYDNIYVPDNQKKLSYKEFVAFHPIFFSQDPYGSLIRFTSTDYQPLAECGKPVIYLYPQQTEKVSVKIEPQGGMTKSEPAYNGGWNVIADPSSNIINAADGKTYPYLFWEGRGGMYETPQKGFVVARADIHQFLVDKLTQLGLNEQESKDFMDFWEPKMQGSPYYFVTFMGNNVMDSLAPLSISPKPDTVIRVLMDFTPLDHAINAQGFQIRAPERKGFTVVEWGGVLR